MCMCSCHVRGIDPNTALAMRSMAPPCTIVNPHWRPKRASWLAPLPLGKSSDHNCLDIPSSTLVMCVCTRDGSKTLWATQKCLRRPSLKGLRSTQRRPARHLVVNATNRYGSAPQVAEGCSLTRPSESRTLASYTNYVLCATSIFTATSDVDREFFSAIALPAGPARWIYFASLARTIRDYSNAVALGPRV